MSANAELWAFVVAFVVGVLAGWLLVRWRFRRRGLRSWLNGRVVNLAGPESYRVTLSTARGKPEVIPYGSEQGQNACKAYFDAMRYPGAVGVTFHRLRSGKWELASRWEKK